MSFLPGMFPAIAAGKRSGSFSLTYMETRTSLSAANISFSSVPFGAAPAAGDRRYIAAAICGLDAADTRTISDVTIGGETATLVPGTERAGVTTPCGVWIAEVPTGTSGTVAFTYGSSLDFTVVGVFRVMNPRDPLGAGGTFGVHSSGVVTLDMTVPPDGAAAGATISQNASTTTWTGLSEHEDTDLNSGEFVTTASATSAAGGSPLTIRATNADTSPSQYVGTAASWGPDTLVR